MSFWNSKYLLALASEIQFLEEVLHASTKIVRNLYRFSYDCNGATHDRLFNPLVIFWDVNLGIAAVVLELTSISKAIDFLTSIFEIYKKKIKVVLDSG